MAQDKNGPIRADENCMVLMPLYQKQGDDGVLFGSRSGLLTFDPCFLLFIFRFSYPKKRILPLNAFL